MSDPAVPNSVAQRAVDDAIVSRRSVRAFLPTPVPEATIREMRSECFRMTRRKWRVVVGSVTMSSSSKFSK